MKNKLIVITSYPDKRQGVAWHAEKTLTRLAKSTGIICLVQKDAKTKPQKKHNLTVIPTFKKGSLFALFQTLPYILKHSDISDILIQFEFNILGGFLPVITLPLFLAVLKLLKKNITFEMHQVVHDISVLEHHINVHTRIMQTIFTYGIRTLYRSVGLFADNVIVLEEHLKKRLAAYIPSYKISVVSLSVTKEKIRSKMYAKKKLGFSNTDFVIVVFGFINWYKGSDWIAQTVSHMKDKRIKLVLAGGKNPTLTGKLYYESFYENIKTIAQISTNITVTGFIDDKTIELYYSAADVLVLPYRVFMSASGPFSIALSYKKPVLLSEPLKDYAEAHDFMRAMYEANISHKELFFSLDDRKFGESIMHIMNDKKLYGRLERFAALLAAKRDETYTERKYYYAIFHKYRMIKHRSLFASLITPTYEKLS